MAALTFEQFKSLRRAGKSVEDIRKFEALRGNKPQPQQQTAPRQSSNQQLQDIGMPGRQETEQRIAGRQNIALDLQQLIGNAGVNISRGNPAFPGGNIPGTGPGQLVQAALNQKVEAGVANPAIAMQKGEFDPKVLGEEIRQGLIGEKLSEFGDVYKNVGVPDWLAGPLGMLNLTAVYMAGGKMMDTGGKLLKKVPISKLKPKSKAIIDAQQSDIGQSIVDKSKAQVKEIGNMYEKVWDAHGNSNVATDTFTTVRNLKPKGLRIDVAKDYGSGIVDVRGNPMSTVGKLKNLNTTLGEMLKRPDLLGRVRPSQVVAYKKVVKDAIVKSLPKDAGAEIRRLDMKWGSTIGEVETIVKNIKPNPDGPIKTNYLFDKYSNPKFYGDRHFMRSLKNIGIDLTPEITAIEKSLKQMSIKQSIGKTVEVGGKAAILKHIVSGI